MSDVTDDPDMADALKETPPAFIDPQALKPMIGFRFLKPYALQLLLLLRELEHLIVPLRRALSTRHPYTKPQTLNPNTGKMSRSPLQRRVKKRTSQPEASGHEPNPQSPYGLRFRVEFLSFCVSLFCSNSIYGQVSSTINPKP